MPLIGNWQGALGNDRCAMVAGGGVVARIQGFECIFQVLINLAISAIALAALVMFITSGFKLLTAGGDAKKTGEASQTITLAIVGLVAAIGAWFILRLITQFTGVEVTNFVIPGP